MQVNRYDALQRAEFCLGRVKSIDCDVQIVFCKKKNGKF